MTTKPRISTKRLRAAITKMNEARRRGIGMPIDPQRYDFPSFEVWLAAKFTYAADSRAVSANRATALYSLRSHLRGRLHITHQYVQEKDPTKMDCTGATREVRYDRTMEDQAKLVEPLMVEFQMTEPEAKLDDELRAKRIAMIGSAWTDNKTLVLLGMNKI